MSKNGYHLHSPNKSTLFNAYQNAFNLKSNSSKNLFSLSHSLTLNSPKDCHSFLFFNNKLKESAFDSPNKIAFNQRNSSSHLITTNLMSSPLISKELKQKFSQVLINALSTSQDESFKYNQLCKPQVSTTKNIQVKRNEIMHLLHKDSHYSNRLSNNNNRQLNKEKPLRVNKTNDMKSFLEPMNTRISVKTNLTPLQQMKLDYSACDDHSQDNIEANALMNCGSNIGGYIDGYNRLSMRKEKANVNVRDRFENKSPKSLTPSNKHNSAKKPMMISFQHSPKHSPKENGKPNVNWSNQKVGGIDFSSFNPNSHGSANDRDKDKQMEIKVSVKEENEVFTFRKIDLENGSSDTENGKTQSNKKIE